MRLRLPVDRVCRSPRATAALAARLARELVPGDAIGLIGDLGAGKTAFVRGLARALGVPPEVAVTSPTFTVVNTLRGGRLVLYHFDLYRLSDLDELEAIGYRDFLGAGGVAVFEWADKIDGVLPADAYCVVIEDPGVGNERRIQIAKGLGPSRATD
jgi:tRNA threonylcarbamoyladenosine biosynthesis protein TsaE